MRCYAFSKAGTIAGKRIFLRPVEKAGNGQNVHLRNMRHISLAATTVLQADEGNENIIFGELDLGKKFPLRIYESGNIHDSMAFPARSIQEEKILSLQPYVGLILSLAH